MGRGKLKYSWDNACRDEIKMAVRLDMFYVSIWEVVYCEKMVNNNLIKGDYVVFDHYSIIDYYI
jgi:hypothetical protein